MKRLRDPSDESSELFYGSSDEEFIEEYNTKIARKALSQKEGGYQSEEHVFLFPPRIEMPTGIYSS